MQESEIAKEKSEGNGRYWWRSKEDVKCSRPQPKPGDACPNCHEGKLALDGLFVLACDCCHQIADSGGFT